MSAWATAGGWSLCSSRGIVQVLSIPFLLLVILAGLTGCAWTITPPPTPHNIGVVYVTDYGRHCRLALQVDQFVMVEYSFGDWRYYARDEKSLRRGIAALLFPGDAAFGRRSLPFFAEADLVASSAGAVRSARIEVEREKLDTLIAELDERWEQKSDTVVWSDISRLHFVQDDHRYHLFRNSNHKTATWLRRLGCEVRGTPILSNFRVEER